MASTNYPGSLDAYPVPNNGDTISVADHWLGPAVIGIETELGTDPAGSHTNVKDRLDQVDSAMGFKNRIIGGNFSTNPWQRGTSFTGVSGGSYTADRFVYNQSTTAVVDIFKTADAPTVSEAGVFTQHCLHLDVTTSDVMTGTEYSAVNQRIEGYNVSDLGFGQSGTRYFTLSFWHKHTKTGTNCVSIQNSAQTRSYVAEYTQSVSDTWEKAEITIPVDTSGTWLYDNGIGMFIWFTASSGSANHGTGDSWQAGGILSTSNQVNNLDSTSNNFKIALVQLEAGDKATRFETRSVGQELELCQRYYYRQSASPTLTSASGGLYNTANGRVWAEFPVTMRSNPSLEIEDLTYEIIGTGSTTATSNAGGVTSTHGASWDGLSISVTGYNGQPFAYIGKWNVLAEL